MWDKQEVTEEKPQTNTLGKMLSMIAAHDKSDNPSPVCELDEQQAQVVTPS